MLPPRPKKTTVPTLTLVPSRQTDLHITVAAADKKKDWGIPEIGDDEHTLLLSDSNGPNFAPLLLLSWRIAAFRGPRIHEINHILEAGPIPAQIQKILIHIGINDSSNPEHPLQNTITRLKELTTMRHHSRKFLISTILPFTNMITQLEHRTNLIKITFVIFCRIIYHYSNYHHSWKLPLLDRLILVTARLTQLRSLVPILLKQPAI